jgi:hypothetical protein
MLLSEACKSAALGNAVLFVGAGFSVGSRNLRNDFLKTGGAIADHFASLAGLPSSVGLEELADEVLRKRGVDFLVDELQQEFTVRDLAPFHKEVAAVPWKRIYTTNYDDVIERSFAECGLPLHSVTLSDNVLNFPKDKPLCVHLNGSIRKINRENVTSEIKLTDTSYVSSSIAASPWATLFRQDLAVSQSVFYLGYSLWDLDIKRILFEGSNIAPKSFFALGSNVSTNLSRKVERFGTNTGLTSEQVLAEIATTHVSEAERETPVFYSVTPYIPTVGLTQATDRDVYDLLAIGKIESEFVWQTILGQSNYCSPRAVADLVVAQIKERDSIFALHSHLGNGKTLTLEIIRALGYRQGLEVFSVSKRSPEVLSELEFLLSRTGNLVLTVDNYPDWMDALTFIGLRKRKGLSLILTARSGTHTALAPRLASVLQTQEMREISLDRLSGEDVEGIVSYLDMFGLWAERSTWSHTQKCSYVASRLHSSWQSILLDLFASPDIGSRLKRVVAKIDKNTAYGEVIVRILILTVSGYSLTTLNLADICGPQVFESGFRRDEVINELVDFSRSEVRFRSSIAAEFILQKLVHPKATVTSISAIIAELDKTAGASREYFEMLKALLRFSNMQILFPKGDAAKHAMSVYEKVKLLSHSAENTHFWLQYSIACLAAGEFERSGTYIDAAYAFAKRLDHYDTYQIDNHQARLLLQRSIAFSRSAEGMKDFNEARRLILAQISRERLHYTYSVATLIAEFYDAYKLRINRSEELRIRKTAEQVCEVIAYLPLERQKEADISKCKVSLQRVIAAITE